ncbi:MAG: hypothetical protein II961_00320 [Candidatus Riflebacteria bacterium]|nr:hypothetical protein [Candidatus Riflebacteria bacterium]
MNDLLSQILIYLPFCIIIIIVFACLCRLHFDRKTDERAEAEFENFERISDRAREEAADCSDRIREIKEGTSRIAERTNSAREQIKSASNTIKEARRNNRTAKEAISRIEEILSEAKKI